MRHIPPGYVGLLDKIDEIGRAKYGDSWRGDKVAELREAVPPEISRAPPPIRPLGGSSVRAPAGKIKRGRPPPSAKQLAGYAQDRQAARQQVAEAESQREEAIGGLQKCLSLSERVAYEQLADGSLSSLPRNWAYSDHAVVAFFTGTTDGGRPVLISQSPGNQEEPAEEPGASPEQPTDAGDTTDIAEQIAKWIFAQHPRDGNGPKTKVDLLKAAQGRFTDGGFPGTFTHRQFGSAYQLVYKSQRNAPLVGGWPLNEPYRTRLWSEERAGNKPPK